MPSRIQACTETAKILKGKTIILAPYAKSVTQPPDSFWENLVKEWKNNGYFVCTNVSGNEKPIQGTMPLSLPLNQFVSATEYAGCFIGLRSGLCDVINTARCRKIVVFPDCYYSTTPYKVADFFALPGWETIIWNV